MDTSLKYDRKENPAGTANPLSYMLYLYVFPIFKRTLKQGLTEADLFKPLDEHKSSNVSERLENAWKEEYVKHKKYALHRALFKLFGFQYMLMGFLKLINEVMLVIVMPLSIGRLVSFFEKGQSDMTKTEAYIAAAILVAGLFLDPFLNHPSTMGLNHIAMKMRVSCSSLIYRKSLRLSQTALSQTTVGQLVNLLSNDVSKFEQTFILTHYVWIAPIVAGVGTYLLYWKIGVSAFFGMAFLVSFVPLQMWMGKQTSVLRLKTALKTDERVRLMSEIISGIQVIKMYCWEQPFANLISFARKQEIKIIRSHAYLIGLFYSFSTFITRTCIFFSILGYVLLGEYVSAEIVFSITAIYNCLRPVVTFQFSMSVSSLAEVNISIMRLQKFMSFEERTATKLRQSSEKPNVLLENVNANWTEDTKTLKNINLNIRSSQLVAIVGEVGSGKSSLLNVILEELPLVNGRMVVQGTISYCSQEPWLFSGSVRQNILFGKDLDEARYHKVVDVCALRPDFDLLPHADKTLVGERGKALSGGQKARINLARCIYRDADIYLLDDPLSAVDADVGRHLFERCIRGFLEDKICVFITHQLQYLRDVDRINVMRDGKIQSEGSYDELQQSGMDFLQNLKQFQTDRERYQEKEEISIENGEDRAGPLIEEEQVGYGSLTPATYWAYLRAGGGKIMILLLITAFIAGQFVTNAGDYYISYWANLEEDFSNKVHKNLPSKNDTSFRDDVIYIYAGIISGTIFCAITLTIYYMFFMANASVNLHRKSFNGIIKAPMHFYDNNSSGRILNRFSKDLGYIDEYIPSVLLDVFIVITRAVGTFVLTFMVDLWLIIPSCVLLILFYFFRIVHIRTSRSVKRIEGITRSPIFGHMTASIQGLTTVRVFTAEKILIEEFDQYQDHHSSAWFLYLSSNGCFGFWLDIVCITFVACAVFIVLIFNDDIQGGDIGLVISQYIGLIGTLQWGIRQLSELENQMVSVERILEYTNIESEPKRKGTFLVPPDWPNQGQIQFKNVFLKYNTSDPYVLKNLTFTINPKEKVGIVGRTGAGKSSIITALFQLYHIEGGITIDGIETTKEPLETTRSKISIIPQEPVLFSGTMRKNLDPFEEYADEVLWDALEQVELKGVISDMTNGLMSAVSEGGSNFSVGQRQLVCLARALVRNNTILVLDEATANVDPQTDDLIQNTIRRKFENCTVLTIAHRLHTVMDSDKILVMDAGTIQEFGHPYELLQNKNGILYNLIQSTGKAVATNLEKVAQEVRIFSIFGSLMPDCTNVVSNTDTVSNQGIKC